MMYAPDYEKQRAEDEKAKAYPPEVADGCAATWGNCSSENPAYWGKPTDTPHRCKGVRRHFSKLHACEKCGMLGHQIMPSPYSKAGKQLREAILASEGIKP